jgi:uncharacterized protein
VAEIIVRVIPRAAKSAFAGMRGDALLVRLNAPPIDGAANAALLELFADRLKLPQRALHIVAGERSRTKRVRIDGLTAEQIAAALGVAP